MSLYLLNTIVLLGNSACKQWCKSFWVMM